MSASTSVVYYQAPKPSFVRAVGSCIWFLAKLTIAAVAIFTICLAVCLVALDAAGAHVTTHTPTTTTRLVPVEVTRTLVDDHQRVVDDSWTVYRFTVEQSSDVGLGLNVTQGGAVTVYVMDESSYANFPQGDWKQYEVLRATAKRAHNAVTRLAAGRYVLVVKESSSPNLFFGSDSAFVTVRVTAKRTELRPSTG